MHDERLADRRQAETVLAQEVPGESPLDTQQAEQQMLGSDVAMQETTGFFGGVFQDLLGVLAERYFDRCLDRRRGRADAS